MPTAYLTVCSVRASMGQSKEGSSKRKHEPVKWKPGQEGGSRKKSKAEHDKER